ncbi:glucan biosynthesis protein D [Alcanivorax sp. MM125-6]|nr:glucan biosynthesis protein D [Alcanivorax sp. MM125-6]
MNRRTLLKSAVALAAWSGLPSAPLFAAARANDRIADGEAEPFCFEGLRERARTLATRPYRDAARALPPTLAGLTPHQYNEIGYDAEHALWHGRSDRLNIQFIHAGMGFDQPVRMHSLDPDSGQARRIHFRPELFDYDRVDVDTAQLGEDLGFAGFRVFKAPSLAEKDIVSFLGASYFRAVDGSYQYGLSARGAAVNTYADGEREEFPDFTHFWFETPAPGASRFTAYALLDSPKLAGAYRFVIDCGDDGVVMDIDSHLFPREAITQLGVAPMTSMFSCGGHQRHQCRTLHPRIHDSDRLALWRGNGEWVCRPLNNPPRVQFNTFDDTNPKGFGLLQTHRDFDDYEDVIGRYHDRPSLWVEPKGEWGDGEIQLLELPTTGETMDNVVAFWKPARPLKGGEALAFGYRLHWAARAPVRTDLARVRATLSGMGGFPEGWAPGEHYPETWAERIAVDFVGGRLKEFYDGDIDIDTQLDVSAGRVKDLHVLWVKDLDGFRILFDWYPDSDATEPVNMRLTLSAEQRVVSETWLFQYFPPPPEARRYPSSFPGHWG